MFARTIDFPARRLRAFLALSSITVVAACAAKPTPPDGQLVAQWTRASLVQVRAERLGPPVAARTTAYASLALFEGYAADPTSGLRSLAGQLNGFDGLPAAPAGAKIDGAIAAAAAERVVLDSLFRDGFASTRRTIDSLAAAQIETRVAAGVGAASREASEAHGRALGNAILAWAATDGFFATRGRPWKQPTARNQWQNTATLDQFVPQMLSGQSDFVSTANPNVALNPEQASEKGMFVNRPKATGATTLPTFNPTNPTEPYWGELRTFVIRDGDECAPPPMPEYSEKPGSAFYKIGKEFHDSLLTLTPEKRQTALFWNDNPVATGTPAFHWISVVNQMIPQRKLDAPRAAELYALTSLAIADAFIGCWKEKYRSLVVRPVVYVQRLFDKEFRTVIATPPFPEYPSGHSVQSGAAVEVLIGMLGDSISYVDSSQVDVGQPPRAFASFSAARNDIAWSRVWGGVHYVPAVLEGVVQGECVARRVLALKTRTTP